MDVSIDKILNFVKREKIYIFLLTAVILITLSFSFLNRFLKDAGLEGLLAEKNLETEEIIPTEKIEGILNSNPVLYFIFVLLVIGFILFIIIGLILDAGYLILNLRGKSALPRTRLPGTAGWNFWDICKAAIIFLFAQRIIFLFDIVFLSGAPYLQARENLRIMLSATLVDIIAISAVFYFVLSERKERLASLGLTVKKFFGNIKYGIFAYIGLIPILALVMYLTTVVFKMLDIPIRPQAVLVMLRDERHIPSLIYMGFFASFFGPVLEEIFFRGFVYNALRKKLGVFGGILITTLFFASIHANMASFFPIFCLGIILVYLYEKTGSLIPSMTVHVLHNSISLILLLFVKTIIQ